MPDKTSINIYTDGACSGNPGPGGYGTILVYFDKDGTKHEKELKEQEEMLTRSIAAGQKEANDDARLQARIDAERERVARETGKNPKKIYCTTSTKSNGYIKVKCK